MKAFLEVLPVPANESFRCFTWQGAARAFFFRWHCHPEYELTLTTGCHGKRFIGDHIGEYGDGDLVLVGDRLPHTWVADPAAPHAQRQRIVVVQFTRDCLGTGFFEKPELRSVAALLQRARCGLQVRGKTRADVAAWMQQMLAVSGPRRVILLLEVLQRLADSRELRPLSSPGFDPSLREDDQMRINRVCQHINAHFTEKLALPDVAALVRLSDSAFSRFFKRSTGHSFVYYLNALRIGHVCALLIQTDRSVTQVAFAAGFNNLAHFNRTFRELRGTTPREYRRQFETAV